MVEVEDGGALGEAGVGQQGVPVQGDAEQAQGGHGLGDGGAGGRRLVHVRVTETPLRRLSSEMRIVMAPLLSLDSFTL
ncbi:hypothetical protein GCM10010251_85580 [Streptomyces aurantiogriseus]|uniref:Uncharacterized protein n=1 Tax=Streptomyces aurantiogriseus TaxID=66870 RepID=A0A918KZA8_9ACTN|nr:hypothetical protein GCM10010251_85580 [Streptomyces aurantiogriseus]